MYTKVQGCGAPHTRDEHVVNRAPTTRRMTREALMADDRPLVGDEGVLARGSAPVAEVVEGGDGAVARRGRGNGLLEGDLRELVPVPIGSPPVYLSLSNRDRCEGCAFGTAAGSTATTSNCRRRSRYGHCADRQLRGLRYKSTAVAAARMRLR